MFTLATMFALLAGIAGWYYAFYSPAAARLSGIEAAASNQRRIRLRRVNGLLMCMMAVTFFLGTAALEKRWSAVFTVLLWIAVLMMMLAIAALGLYDLRLTARLRSELKQPRNNDLHQ